MYNKNLKLTKKNKTKYEFTPENTYKSIYIYIYNMSHDIEENLIYLAEWQ